MSTLPHYVDVVLAETLPSELLTDRQIRHQQTAWVLILDPADEETSLDALSTGASAILPRTANLREIVTAITAVTNGLVVFQRQLLAALLHAEPLLGEQLNTSNDGNAQLTARELEVLTAMADGATNKAIGCKSMDCVQGVLWPYGSFRRREPQLRRPVPRERDRARAWFVLR